MHGKRRILFVFREGDSCEEKTPMPKLRRLVLLMLVIGEVLYFYH